MAGGMGTRLQAIAADIPKPMVPVLNKPILEYQIESLKMSGITDIIIIIGHLGNVIRDYFQDGTKWNVSINYIFEDKPLGTAGALYYLKASVREDFLLLFGDLLLDVDWNRFMHFHKDKESLITLFGHPNSHPYDSDLVIVNRYNQVIGVESKKAERNFYYHNFVNAGIYCVNPGIFDVISEPHKMDFEKDIIAQFIYCGKVYAYKSTEYVKDMGTPDRLMAVADDVRENVTACRNLRYRQRCVFLDRDGTINKLHGFLNSAEQFELLPTVAEAVKRLNRSKYLTIVATNQPVIARGECTYEEMELIHMKMETLLGNEGAYLDDIYFCPHHPDKGFAGEVPELKINCECRKPKIGMIQKAVKKYNIDLQESWYIGDSTVDIQTGINAEMHTILLQTGEAGQDGRFSVKPEFTATNLLDAVDYILQGNEGASHGL